jgi:hypothetical protein
MLCDVCESAAAILFCAADEAALCRSCDEKVNQSLSPFSIFFLLIVFISLLENYINCIV